MFSFLRKSAPAVDEKPPETGDEATDELLEIGEAAAAAGVSRSALRQAYRDGRLEGMRRGGRLYVSRSGLEQLAPESPRSEGVAQPAPASRKKARRPADPAAEPASPPDKEPTGSAPIPPDATVPARLLEDAMRQLEVAHYELRHLIGQNASLQFELRGHQRALADGQDLARAREAVHEAAVSEQQAALKAAAVLMEEERQARVQAEADVTCLRARIEMLEADLRRPWWRRLFTSGAARW